MLIITNAINDRPAMIAHCSHEDVSNFAKHSGLAGKVCPIYPVIDVVDGVMPVYSEQATHWTMEPTALKAFRVWMVDSGLHFTNT